MRILRVSCAWLLVLLATAACAAPESTSASPVVSSPPPVSADPSADGVATYFYGLGLHLGSDWEVAEGAMLPPELSIVVDKECLTNGQQFSCPGFVVAPIEQDPAVRPDMRLENGCWATGVVDDRYYGFPEYVGTVAIGGQPAEYFKYRQCSRETGEQGPEVMSMWRIVTKGVVVYDLNLGGKLPTPGLESLLAGATWKS